MPIKESFLGGRTIYEVGDKTFYIKSRAEAYARSHGRLNTAERTGVKGDKVGTAIAKMRRVALPPDFTKWLMKAHKSSATKAAYKRHRKALGKGWDFEWQIPEFDRIIEDIENGYKPFMLRDAEIGTPAYLRAALYAAWNTGASPSVATELWDESASARVRQLEGL